MKLHTYKMHYARDSAATQQTLTWNGCMLRSQQVLKILDHNQQQQGYSTQEQKHDTTLAGQAELMLIQDEVEEGR